MASGRTPSQHDSTNHQSSQRESNLLPMSDFAFSPSPLPESDGDGDNDSAAPALNSDHPGGFDDEQQDEWPASTHARRGPPPADFGFEIELDGDILWRQTRAEIDELLRDEGERRRATTAIRQRYDRMTGTEYAAALYNRTGVLIPTETHISGRGRLVLFTDASHALPGEGERRREGTHATIAMAVCHREDGWYVQGRGIGQVLVTTTAEAEAITMAIDFALHYADEWRDTDDPLTTVTIVTDSQDVLTSLRRDFLAVRELENPDQPLLRNLEFLSRWQLLLDRGIRVQLRWVRGHSGNLGNTIADRAAYNLRMNIANPERPGFQDHILYWQWPPLQARGANPMHLVFRDPRYWHGGSLRGYRHR